ncbi:MAG: hypothetical protein ABSC18_05455 [Verrucomicrobiota bacterium]|jgi:uncharacterized integral membrane protein
MNIKLLCKALLIIAVLALLVVMGMHNPQTAKLDLPFLPKVLEQPACYMYYGFFGVGFLVGTLLMAGGKKGAGKPGKDK